MPEYASKGISLLIDNEAGKPGPVPECLDRIISSRKVLEFMSIQASMKSKLKTHVCRNSTIHPRRVCYDGIVW